MVGVARLLRRAYARAVSDPDRIIGTVEDLLESILFADSDERVQRLKREW